MSVIHVTRKHTGKMEGNQSISTSCRFNDRCSKYAKIPGSVCAHCYAQKMHDMYKNLGPCLQKNAEILTSVILDRSEMPKITNSIFRFEAFGDLINATQAKNYFNICEAYPKTAFALWTKNPDIIEEAINDGYKKPENLQIIVSSLFKNKVYDGKQYDFIDRIFTVYDKDYILENGVNVNCGKKKCIDCQLCYHKNNVKHINELLK